MNIEQQLTSSLKLIMTVVLIVLVGALFGATGYFLGSENIKKQMPGVYYNESQNEQISEDSNNEEKPIDLADEMADWQTYKNEEYGFEIKYPEEWIFEISSENVGKKIVFSSGIIINVPDPEVGYEAWSVASTEKNGFITKRILEPVKGSENLGGLIVAHWNKGGDYFENTGRLMLEYEKKNDKRIAIFNQMLSTLKFIEGNKENSLEIYNGSKIKMGRGFSFKYSTEIWDLEGIDLKHKKLDGCVFSPGVLSRNRLVNIISDEDITLNNYEARVVKIGNGEEVSSVDLYFDTTKSIVFSLSLPEKEEDKITCEKDFKETLSTIEFKN